MLEDLKGASRSLNLPVQRVMFAWPQPTYGGCFQNLNIHLILYHMFASKRHQTMFVFTPLLEVEKEGNGVPFPVRLTLERNSSIPILCESSRARKERVIQYLLHARDLTWNCALVVNHDSLTLTKITDI